ncbi:MAG: hypothetical protein H6733_12920 [Alphaproteobacteria bacterium]|nr:hypothetical protein [Alphaproteobacteria bacterium]
MLDTLPYDLVSRQLVRALRGRQSQRALSLRLGTRANTVNRWERGLVPVYTHDAFRLAALRGRDVRAALRDVWPAGAEAIASLPVDSPDAAAQLVAALIDGPSTTELAARLGLSRHALARMARGTARVRFAHLLALLDERADGALTLLAHLVDPAAMTATAQPWRQRQAVRQLYVDQPWSVALPLHLDAAPYRAASAHDSAWLARRLGTTADQVDAALGLLADVGAVAWDGCHWVRLRDGVVEPGPLAGADPRATAWWTAEALRRMDDGQAMSALCTFCVDEATLQAVQETLLAGFRSARARTRTSTDGQRVGMIMVHLVSLDDAPVAVAAK